MNIASAELLQHAINNLGDSFGRSRAMDAENAYRTAQLDEQRKRTAVDDSFRNAQLEHYKSIEKKEDDRFGFTKAAQEFSNASKLLPDSLQNLRATTKKLANSVVEGEISPDEADTIFRDGIDTGIAKDNPTLHARLLDVPEFREMYQGGGNWMGILQKIQDEDAKASKPVMPTIIKTPSGAELAVGSGNKFTRTAMAPPPVKPPTQSTVETVSQKPNPAARFDKTAPSTINVTNLIKKVTGPVGAAPSNQVSGAAIKAALANELSKQNPDWTREQIISEVNKRFSK